MRVLVGLVAAAVVLASTPTNAQEQPRKPECVAPAKPGGGFDLTCRIAIEALDKAGVLDKPMAVTFMPGGIGAVAYNLFNSTRMDDANAIVAFSSGSALNLATGKFGNWSEKDARFVASVGVDYGVVVVRDDSKYKSLGRLMNALKKNPAAVVIGAGGSVGSQDWMKAALLLQAAGQNPRQMRYVAFEGGGESISNLLGGNIEVYTGDASEMKAHLGSGGMRILAALAPERLPAPFADIPTATEMGYDVEWPIFRGFYMGKNVSDDAYNFYVDAFRKVYASPDFEKIQEDKGMFPLDMAGQEFEDYVRQRVAKQRKLAEKMGLIQK